MSSQLARLAAVLALTACSGSQDATTGSGSGSGSGSAVKAGSGSGSAEPPRVMSVDGHDVDMASFRILYSVLQGGQPGQRAQGALESLVRRELLAAAATEKGITVTDAQVDDEIKKSNFLLAGERHSLGDNLSDGGMWSKSKFDAFLGALNTTAADFHAEQARELLAVQMAESIRTGAKASPADARAEYMRLGDTVTFDAVVFKSEEYARALHPTTADYERYAAEHTDELKARYTQDAALYKGRKPELQLREIAITGTPAQREAAKAKLEAVRADVAAGKAKLADAAHTLNTDPALAASSGDVGWRLQERAALGDKALSEAVKSLKPGELTAVIASENGTFLVQAEAARSGDLTFDQVKLEIAQTLAKDVWANEAARRAALAAVTALRPGDKSLTDLFQRVPKMTDDPEIKKLLEGQDLQPVQKQQLIAEIAQSQHKSTGNEPHVPPKPSPDGPVITAGKDVLPALATVPPPQVESFGPVSKGSDLGALHLSKEQLAGLYALAPGNASLAIYEPGQGLYVVVQLEARTIPTADDFAHDEKLFTEKLDEKRGGTAVQDWLRTRCQAAAKANRIRVNPEIVGTDGPPYVPCFSLAADSP